MPVNEMIGWLGSFLFSICALPQVIQTWRTKKADDLNALFLWFWFWGEVFTLIYIVWTDISQGVYHLPLYFNYCFNLILVVYLLFAKYFYKTAVK
ncbi:MAG: PQ-loop domain-containing transporter [Rhodothermaceae bacterium]